MTEGAGKIDAAILVYNAYWSAMGALRYLGEMIQGGGDCALCEITHGRVAEKGSWKDCKASLNVPVEYLYRDSAGAELWAAIKDEYPAVAARIESGFVRLLDRHELEALKGDPEMLRDAIQNAAKRAGLYWD